MFIASSAITSSFKAAICASISSIFVGSATFGSTASSFCRSLKIALFYVCLPGVIFQCVGYLRHLNHWVQVAGTSTVQVSVDIILKNKVIMGISETHNGRTCKPGLSSSFLTRKYSWVVMVRPYLSVS